jgi:hypothetical protein
MNLRARRLLLGMAFPFLVDVLSISLKKLYK